MPTPDSLSITLFPDPKKGAPPPKQQQPRRPPPPAPSTNRRPARIASRVLQLLIGHCPSEILDRTALTIIDYAYTALLEIAPPEGSQSVVEVSAPVAPTDPYSPLVHVDASSTHCRIRLPYSRRSIDGRTCVVEQIKSNHPAAGSSSSRASLSVSPAEVHLVAARVVRPARWRFVDARSDASSEGLLMVLRTIVSLLDEAISRETTLLEMARAGGFGRCPKADGIVAARTALEEMRAVLDVDAMITHRRRRQKRCRRVREMMADAEMLTDRMRTLHVDEDEVQDDDEVEVLAKRMRTLCV